MSLQKNWSMASRPAVELMFSFLFRKRSVELFFKGKKEMSKKRCVFCGCCLSEVPGKLESIGDDWQELVAQLELDLGR